VSDGRGKFDPARNERRWGFVGGLVRLIGAALNPLNWWWR
jgi:hypothetical protein